MPDSIHSRLVRTHIREVEVSDFVHHDADELLQSLDLAIVDVVDDFVELARVLILFDEKESIFTSLPRGPAGRARKEDGIKSELELVFPLFDRFIATSSLKR